MLRNSHKRRPPFVFSRRALAENLPCDPKITTRGNFPTYFPEFRMFPGPQVIGVTGDNTYGTLYGRTWAILFCDDDHLYVMQWSGSAWTIVTDLLPTFPAFDGSERAFTAAFDQSARFIYAYEKAGVIKVTRWDSDSGAYIQNVNVTGVDPTLLMDATITRKVPDSDVLLFYVSSDRTRVHYRVQRESYGVPHDLLLDGDAPVSYPDGVILDQAQALPYRFELLVADAEGGRRELALVSNHYPIPISDDLSVTATPSSGEHRQTTYLEERTNTLDLTGAPGTGIYSLTITINEVVSGLGVTAAPVSGRYQATTTLKASALHLDVTAAPSGGVYGRTTFDGSAAIDLSVSAAPGTGAYRAV